MVGKQSRERLLPIAVRLAAAKAGVEANEKIRRAVRAKVLCPGGLIAVVLRGDEDELRHRENYAATACAVQNMLLVATSHGLGSKWGTGKLTRHTETAALLEVDSTVEEVVGFVWIGHSARIPTVERPPLNDHVHRLP